MYTKVISLRGRAPGTELVTIDVLLEDEHALGWRGWLVEDRMSPVKSGHPLLWLSADWVEYASIERFT